jgi:hypothetical protein
MAYKLMDFECMLCRQLFEQRWFDLARSLERVHFRSPEAFDEVEVSDAESVGVFCSSGCLQAGRAQLMQDQGVPIPSVRPGIGPLEQCAKCHRPVDMSAWHLTYTECESLEEVGRFGIQTIELGYVAVVCRDCAPRHGTSSVTQNTEENDGMRPVKTS